jgi:hypothetical protein
MKCFKGLVVACVAVCLTAVLCSFSCAEGVGRTLEDDSPAAVKANLSAKITVKQDGKVQGMWAESQQFTMALVSKLEAEGSPVPYVCVYRKNEAGRQESLPVALSYWKDELHLQIPRDGKTPILVPMRRVAVLLEAADQLHNEAK